MRSGRTARAAGRSGVTLLELLIVVSIIVLVTAIAIPTIGPLLKGREVREASRTASAFFTQAQTRAIELGRPVGVAIVRGDASPDAGIQLFLCETPPAYAGLSETDRAVVGLVDGVGLHLVGFRDTLTGPIDPSVPPKMFRVGDMIRLGIRGPRYQISLPAGASSAALDADGYLTTLPWRLSPLQNGDHPSLPSMRFDSNANDFVADLPFQIFRRPIKTSDEPASLPPGAVIDLSASGYEGDVAFSLFYAAQNNLTPQPTGDVIITYEPDGAIGGVYVAGRLVPPRTTPIYLLLGKQQKTAAVGQTLWIQATSNGEALPKDPVFNMHDGDSLWMKLEPSTGLITTSPLEPPPDLMSRPSDGVEYWSQILASRVLAREGAAVGGGSR